MCLTSALHSGTPIGCARSASAAVGWLFDDELTTTTTAAAAVVAWLGSARLWVRLHTILFDG